MKDRIKQLVETAWGILDDKGSHGEVVINAREFIELVQYLKGYSVEEAVPPAKEIDPECAIVQFFLAFLASNGKAPCIGTLLHTFEQHYTSVHIQETRAALLRRATDPNRYIPGTSGSDTLNVSQRLERAIQVWIREKYRENFRIPDYLLTREALIRCGWGNVGQLPSLGEFIQMYVSSVLAIDFKEPRLDR